MTILVTEKCMHDLSNGSYTGTRIYCYDVDNANSLEEAIKVYSESFNSDNISRSFDDFEEDCLDSYTESISIYEQ